MLHRATGVLLLGATALAAAGHTGHGHGHHGSVAVPRKLSHGAVPPRDVDHQPHTTQAYTEMKGYLAAGDDMLDGSYTWAQACDQCDAIDCAGFTFEDAAEKPTSPVHVFFKSAVNFVPSDGWFSYVSSAPVPYPDINMTVGGLTASLRSGSHTMQILSLVDDPMPPHNFSFVPPLSAFNRPDRTGPGHQQLGDISLRIQQLSSTNSSSWALFSSAWGRSAVPLPGPFPPGVFATDDITPLLNATPATDRIEPSIPLSLRVTRTWSTYSDPVSGDVGVQLTVNLTALKDTRVGGLGFSLPADDNTNQQLEQIAFTNSFSDPHIGADHGFVEWVRVVGNASLLVTPGPVATLSAGDTWVPQGRTPFQAWRPLLEDPQFNGVMSEWTVLSAAWAAEWGTNRQAPVLQMPADLLDTGVWGARPYSPWPSWHSNETVRVPDMGSRYWNPPTSVELKAGEGVSYSVLLGLTANGPRSRDAKLADRGEPVLQGIPGYVVSLDSNSSFLYVRPPRGASLSGVTTAPAGILAPGAPIAVGDGRLRVPLAGLSRGRVRLSLSFSDGSEGVAHYHVLPPFPALLASAGQHWAHTAWLPLDYPDPFGRSAAVLPWDREDRTWVLDDSRAYIVGLSDDAGAAQNLAHAMKIAFAPVPDEVAQKDSYIKNTLMGTKPGVAHLPLRSLQTNSAIRMTMYYYCPDFPRCNSSGHFDYAYPEQDKCNMPVGGPIWCMVESMADQTYRGYNVPHQAATWYAMYRVARFYDGISTLQPWGYYLQHAFELTNTLGTPDVGLMDGTIFREILLALVAEGASNATIRGWGSQITANMLARASDWSTKTFPYGSEFNWDTTGQEEVWVWLQHFNYTAAANRTLNSMLAYSSTFPNWAYNGGSRSIGDLGNNGKWFVSRGTERLLQHYRAGLNAIPLMEAFMANPDDRLLLDIAVGAQAGQLANIDADGAVSMGFHSVPFVLEFDPHSGDYGLGFTGHTLEIASVLLANPGDPTLPFLCYFCNFGATLNASGSVTFSPTDSYRVRAYLEPIGALVMAETGTLEMLSVNLAAKSLALTLSPPSGAFTIYYLTITKRATTRPGTGFAVSSGGITCPQVRGSFQCPTSQGAVVAVAWV